MPKKTNTTKSASKTATNKTAGKSAKSTKVSKTKSETVDNPELGSTLVRRSGRI